MVHPLRSKFLSEIAKVSKTDIFAGLSYHRLPPKLALDLGALPVRVVFRLRMRGNCQRVMTHLFRHKSKPFIWPNAFICFSHNWVERLGRKPRLEKIELIQPFLTFRPVLYWVEV